MLRADNNTYSDHSYNFEHDPPRYFPGDTRYSFAKNIEQINPKLNDHSYYILSKDIPHDANDLKSPFYKACVNSLLTPNARLDKGAESTAPVGGKPSIANKKTCMWDHNSQMLVQIPNPVNPFPDETMNIRDTEQGSDYYKPEDITPSWYLDPALRSFFAQGWERVKEVVGTEFIIDVSKYGVQNSTITFRTMTADVIDVSDTSITFPNIEILCIEIRYNYIDISGNTISGNTKTDTYTDYIDSEGFAIYNTGTNTGTVLRYADQKNDVIQSSLFGNDVKNKWLTSNKKKFDELLKQNSRTPTDDNELKKLHKLGMRLLVSKRYGDLSHLLFTTNENIIGSNDTYLADLAFLHGSSVMLKGRVKLLMNSQTIVSQPDKVDIKGVFIGTKDEIYHCNLKPRNLIEDQTGVQTGGVPKKTSYKGAKTSSYSARNNTDSVSMLRNYGIDTNKMTDAAIRQLATAVETLKNSGRKDNTIRGMKPREIKSMANSESLRKYFVSHNDELHNRIKTDFYAQAGTKQTDYDWDILEGIVGSIPSREFFCYTYNPGSYNIYWNLYNKYYLDPGGYDDHGAARKAVRDFALRGASPDAEVNQDIDREVFARRAAMDTNTEDISVLDTAINFAIEQRISLHQPGLNYEVAASDIAAAYGTNITAGEEGTQPVVYGYNGKLTYIDDVDYVDDEMDGVEMDGDEMDGDEIIGGGDGPTSLYNQWMTTSAKSINDNTETPNPLNKMISFDNKNLTEFINKEPGDSYTVKQLISFIYENCTSNTKKNIHNEKAKLKKYIENEKLLDEKTEDPLLTDLNVNIIINVAINANIVSVGEMEIFFLYIICKKSNNTIGSFLKTLDAFKIIMQDSFYFLNYNFLEEIHKLANEENSVIEESTLEIILKNCVKNGSIKIEEEPGSSVVFDTEEETGSTNKIKTLNTVFKPREDEVNQLIHVLLEKTLEKLKETNKKLDNDVSVTNVDEYAAIIVEPNVTIGGVIKLIEDHESVMKDHMHLINSIKTLNEENLNKIQKKLENDFYKERTVFNHPTRQGILATVGGNPQKIGTKKKRDKQSKRISHRKKNKTGTPKNRKTKKNGTRKNKKSKK